MIKPGSKIMNLESFQISMPISISTNFWCEALNRPAAAVSDDFMAVASDTFFTPWFSIALVIFSSVTLSASESNDLIIEKIT